jgi:hypothetical protein
MVQPVQYSYSLKFSVATLLVLLILMLILLNSAATNRVEFIWVVYGFIGLVFVSLGTVLVLKRLAPALKGDVALQLDDEGISDYVKDVTIRWNDIQGIELIRGRTASIMRVDLKWESDYGSQIAIYLRWVKGDDKEIYETTMAYFSNCANEV